MRYGIPYWRAWLWFAQGAGLLVIACAITAAFLWLTAGTGPVLVATGPPYGISSPVKVGGPLSYRLDFFLRENCPGEIVSVYRTVGLPISKVVEQRRPASFTRPAAYPGTPFSRDLPPEVTPGRWQATVYRESQCLTRRVVDQFAFFEFLVEP
jgi:hypothetical protein